MDVKIRHNCDLEDVKQQNANATQFLADSNRLLQAHAVSDPIFAPVRKLPPEILGKIFIECIPSLELSLRISFENGMHQQQVRARLARVCRVWNAILINEPGVWATLVLDKWLPAPDIVSLWIKRSKSHPLDISLQIDGFYGYMDRDAGVTVVKMLHRELWRIRSFFAEDFIDYYDISPLFPPDLLTEAPMMQSLALQCKIIAEGHLGWMHCPQLRTLTLQNCNKGVESLISKPMQNLRVLTIVHYSSDVMLYITLLQALPDLVSLTWCNYGLLHHDEIPKVVLQSLKSLTLQSCQWEIMTHLLRHFDVPSLEHLELEDFGDTEEHQGNFNTVLDVICGDGAVRLCRLSLSHGALRGLDFHAMWHHLKHLETLRVTDNDVSAADELVIALSPPNLDFSCVCPHLKTLELLDVKISTGALVDFVQRRVKSDLGGSGSGLVTCLKLSILSVDKEVFAQLAKTHSLSIDLSIYY